MQMGKGDVICLLKSNINIKNSFIFKCKTQPKLRFTKGREGSGGGGGGGIIERSLKAAGVFLRLLACFDEDTRIVARKKMNTY